MLELVLTLVSEEISEACMLDGQALHGRVQVVEHFADFRVKIVDHFPDLKVLAVDHFPNACGKWTFVEHFPDFTITFVDSFPDFTIAYVDSFPGVD